MPIRGFFLNLPPISETTLKVTTLMILKLDVYLNASAYEIRKPVFERIVNIPVGVSIPFDSLISDMKFLFGIDSIILIQIS